MDEVYVICNMCGYISTEDKLPKKESHGGHYVVCSNCNTDAYLMDLDMVNDKNIIERFMKMTKVDKKLLELGYVIVADEDGDDEKEFLRYEYEVCGSRYFLSFFPRKNRVCIGLDVWGNDKLVSGNVAERLDPIVLIRLEILTGKNRFLLVENKMKGE